MFTGLIEEIGIIKKITPIAGGRKFCISGNIIFDDLKIDDSVAVNGVCLTVTDIKAKTFEADAVGETLTKSTLAYIKENTNVNLERALRLSDRLGGHIVQGHVNGIGEVAAVKRRGDNYLLEIIIPSTLEKYVVEEGSVTINGVSLTVADLKGIRIGLSIIPHTWHKTVLNNLGSGDKVNIETDVLAKYIEKLINKSDSANQKFSHEWFKNLGYQND